MSLNSQGHSNLAQDSSFCRVALTDAWDVFVTLLDISSAGLIKNLCLDKHLLIILKKHCRTCVLMELHYVC